MFKKIVTAALCALALGSAHAGTVSPLTQLSQLSSVSLHWGGGPFPVGSSKEITLDGYDQLDLDINYEGDYSFNVLRPANSNMTGNMELTVGSWVSTVAFNTNGWHFGPVHLLDNDYLLSLRIFPTSNGAGNPTFNYAATNLVITDQPLPPQEAVPEPESLALLGLGMLGLAIARRRKA